MIFLKGSDLGQPFPARGNVFCSRNGKGLIRGNDHDLSGETAKTTFRECLYVTD